MYTNIHPKLEETSKTSIESILNHNQITTFPKNSKSTNRPAPIDKEINLDPSKSIMSKTDARGIIEYANDYFMEISGYEEYELMGQPHNIIRHPDMPQVIFKLMWDRLNKGENIHAFVKNLAKDGRYYWVLTNFETKYDEEGIIISHYARRKAAPKNAIYSIDKLYKTLRAIERRQGLETSEKYLMGLLEEKQVTYDAFILNLLNIDTAVMDSYFGPIATKNYKTNKSPKRGFMSRLFK